MKKGPKESPEKYKCNFQNIHLSKAKYPQSSEEPLNFSTFAISDINYISQVYSASPNNQCSMLRGSKQRYLQLYHMYIGKGDKTLLINGYKRPSICNLWHKCFIVWAWLHKTG